jgi:hypothetical protein
LAGIDNLRVGLSALVVAHHALQPYAFNQNWWVVERAPPVPELGLLLWVDACFFMGFFFLLAGLFTPASIDRKGLDGFTLDRLRRLGIPLLLGLFVLLPPVAWWSHVHNRPLGWISFRRYVADVWFGMAPPPPDWPYAHWPDANLGHLWFVEHLLVYGLLYAAWRRVRRRAPSVYRAAPADAAILAYTLGLAVATWIVRRWYPMNAWTAILGFLQSEPAHLPQYMSLFVVGLAAGRHDWFTTLSPAVGRRWLIIGLAAVGVATIRAMATGTIPVNALEGCVLEAFVCTGLVTGLLVASRDRWNRRMWITGLGPDTFTVYVFHYGVVVALHILLLDMALGVPSKAVIAVGVGVVLSFALGRLIRRMPGATSVV